MRQARSGRPACYGALVTLDVTGVVLVRRGARETLAALFSAWGQPLSPTRLAGFSAPRGTRPSSCSSTAAAGAAPLSALVLTRHAEIVLELGPAFRRTRRTRSRAGSEPRSAPRAGAGYPRAEYRPATMSRARNAARSMRALALVPAGAFAVHQLRYLLAYGHRAGNELAAQGHSYLDSIVPWIVLLVASRSAPSWCAWTRR